MQQRRDDAAMRKMELRGQKRARWPHPFPAGRRCGMQEPAPAASCSSPQPSVQPAHLARQRRPLPAVRLLLPLLLLLLPRCGTRMG